MSEYLKRLAIKTFGVFLAGLLGFVALAQPFNILTFDWKTALVGSASIAAVALLEGLAGRFTGDKDAPTVTR